MPINSLSLQDGLSIRPAHERDKPFLESLYKSTRDDLRLIDAEDDFVDELIDQQHHAQTIGYGDQFPNAMYFVIYKQNIRIGRVVIDFGPNEIRIVDIAFIPQAKSKGYGTNIIRALKKAAGSIRAPLVLSVNKANSIARSLYRREGFRIEVSTEFNHIMAWYPTAQYF